MLVSVCVSGSKLVMNVLGYRKRRQQEQKTNEADGKPSGEPARWKKPSHKFALTITAIQKLSKRGQKAVCFTLQNQYVAHHDVDFSRIFRYIARLLQEEGT